MTTALHVDQARTDGLIGASRAAAALGCDQYTSPLAVYRELRGEPVNDTRPAFVQEAAEWGQALEPIIRGKYALDRGVGVFVPTASIVKDGWLRATPDGFVVLAHPAVEHFDELIGHTYSWKNDSTLAGRSWEDRAILHARTAGALGLVQVKTCTAYKLDEWEEGVPLGYEIQVRVEMAVANLPWCDVVCLVGGQKRIEHRIERDLRREDAILTDLHDFHRRVQEGREPSPDHTVAWREYASSKMRASKVAIPVTAELGELVTEAKRYRKAMDAAERGFETVKTEMLLRLSAAGATAIDLGGGKRVTAYKAPGGTSWKDYAIALGGAKECPDQYKTPSTKWALRIPGDGDE